MKKNSMSILLTLTAILFFIASSNANCLKFAWNPGQHRSSTASGSFPTKTDSVLVTNSCANIKIDSIYLMFPKILASATTEQYWDPYHYLVKLHFDIWEIGKGRQNPEQPEMYLNRYKSNPHTLAGQPYFLVPEPSESFNRDKLYLTFPQGESFLGDFFSEVDDCPVCKVSANGKGVYDSLSLKILFFSNQFSTKITVDTLNVFFENQRYASSIGRPKKRPKGLSSFISKNLSSVRIDGKTLTSQNN